MMRYIEILRQATLRYDEIWGNMIIKDKMRWDEILWYKMKNDKIWSDMKIYDEIWWDMMRWDIMI